MCSHNLENSITLTGTLMAFGQYNNLIRLCSVVSRKNCIKNIVLKLEYTGQLHALKIKSTTKRGTYYSD